MLHQVLFSDGPEQKRGWLLDIIPPEVPGKPGRAMIIPAPETAAAAAAAEGVGVGSRLWCREGRPTLQEGVWHTTGGGGIAGRLPDEIKVIHEDQLVKVTARREVKSRREGP